MGPSTLGDDVLGLGGRCVSSHLLNAKYLWHKYIKRRIPCTDGNEGGTGVSVAHVMIRGLGGGTRG